jgi:hypothetical protein
MWRPGPCPFLAGVLTPLLALQPGCGSNPDREPLKGLLVALAEAIQEDYQDEIKTHPKEEWAVRRGALVARRDMKVIDEFLQGNPPLSERGRAAVQSLRETCRKRAELLEGIMREGRFTLMEAEKEEQRKLMQEHQDRVKEIGRIVDGK